MKFKVGDIVKGIPGNGYTVTDENMYKGEVIKASDDSMRIKILDHRNKNLIGEEYIVNNEKLNFELISQKKPTKEELLKMPVGTKITTDAEECNVFVKTDRDRASAFFNDDADSITYTEIYNDLSLNEDYGYGTKIIKIEVPTYETVYDSSKEVKEMTMDEVCKALGYNVKIVKEEN